MNADPVQLLDSLSPPDHWTARTDLDIDATAARILEAVFADIGDNVVSLDSPRRRRRGVGAAVTVAAVVVGGAVAALWNRSADETRRIACWSQPVDPPAELVLQPWDGQTDPVEICGTEWDNGSLPTPAPPDDLRACVTDSGTVAVIPGSADVCDRLGLADYGFIPDDEAAALNEAQLRLDLAYRPEICETRARAAEEETREVLDDVGLSGWTITIAGPFSADEPCATVFLDPELSTAFVRSRPQDF